MNKDLERRAIPYVVIVQSHLYDTYDRRVVIPLVERSVSGKMSNSRLNPSFRINNVAVALHPLAIVSVDKKALGEKVDSLANERDRIIGALMRCFSRDCRGRCGSALDSN